jgi:pyruvate dehydrogenase E2 component (dihydrolipoamide acetyltransferase)
MARWEYKLPDIGEGVTEGEIVGWLVKPGDAVREDQPVVEVMTDKATVTITAPKAGMVVETRGRVGEVVPVHSVLVVFELGGGASAAGLSPASYLGGAQQRNGHAPHQEGPAATAVGDIKETLPGMGGGDRQIAMAPGYYQPKPLATPATRKLARDMNVDLRHVPPSGTQGRVTRKDVETFARIGPSAPDPSLRSGVRANPAPPVPAGPVGLPGFSDASAPAPAHAPAGAARFSPARGGESALEERVPFAGVRRRIAQKMALSKHTAAHFTFVEECDVTALKALRARLRAPAESAGVKLTFLPFVVKATVAALKKHPMLNTALDEVTGELVFKKYFHIGVATATDAGLLVPVVRDADRKSILDVARELERLSTEARAGRAKLEDLQGSTFTITSLGAQGGLFATPIINFPEVAILGVHQMKQRPVVRDGQIVVGDVMLLSLSFDHRIVDGHVGAAFAYEIIRYLENPDALWLEMA